MRTPPRSAGIKGERVQAHNSFSFRSRAFLQISRVSTRQTALVLRRVSGGCCPVLLLTDGVLQLSSAVMLRPPLGASVLLKECFWKSKSKRAPWATGVFLKMASRSCASGCGRFLASSDGQDRCPSCLGYQHAEAALVDESCSHCGNMTIAMLRSRYLLAKWGGIPLAMPRSSSSGFRRATSAHGQGDLRITVRASPSSTSPRASHSSSASHHLVFPDELVGSLDRAGPSISFGAPADDRMLIAASGDE